MVECGALIWVHFHLASVYSQKQIDPNSLFCYIPNQGAPIAFCILYGISAVLHWYQCWYVHTLSTIFSLVLARLGLSPCAKSMMLHKAHHRSTGDIRLNTRSLWGSVLPLRLVGSSTSHPLPVRLNQPQSASPSKFGLRETPIILERG